MQLSPWILGAGPAVLIAGVAGGAALGTVPPMQQRGVHELLPQAREIAFAGQPQADLPDHYPLITRAGRFEVGDLALRGLYSQARYNYHRGWYAATDPADLGFDSVTAVEADPVVMVELAPDIDWSPPAESPEESIAPVGATVAEVTPRVIDVAAELAARY